MLKANPTPLPKWVPEWLAENEIFSAGCGLVGVGAAAALFRNGLTKSIVSGKRLFLASLEIPSTDHAYHWVLQYLIHKNQLRKHLGLRTAFAKTDTLSKQATTSYDFIPSTGRHYIRYRNYFLLLDRSRASTMIDLQSGTPWETLTITSFAWDRHIFNDLLEASKNHALAREEGSTLIFKSFGQDWRQFGSPKINRPFESVILAEGLAETVKSDVKNFMSSSEWYFAKGIPYRRGYLLHGPPGCGKTSLVMALAGELKYNICLLNVGDPVMTDDRLHYLLATIPNKSIVLLEDIDGAIPASEALGGAAMRSDNPYGSRRITFSGLLNALDGVVATEERIVFMTTNHIDRLPTSLVRPGRIDLKIRVDLATPFQLEQMFLRFFPDERDKAKEFSAILQNIPMSIAELQNFFLFSKDTPELAVKMALKWRGSEELAAQSSG